MTKLLPLLLAGLLATPVHAFDVLNQDDAWAPKEKPAKAPREKNDGKWLENRAKEYVAGFAAGTVNNAIFGAVGAMNPWVAVPTVTLIGQKLTENRFAKINAFYSGSVVRGKVTKVVTDPADNDFGWPVGAMINGGVKIIPEKHFGFDLNTFPSDLAKRFDAIHLDVDGPDGAAVFAISPKGSGLGKGDIVDVKQPVGVFALNTWVSDNLRFDFNKHMPRVVNVYCKHDNPVCQDDYNSSLGVISRPNLTEFPPSQYLIDPAIIAADQERMRKEEADKKAAQNSGGFNFL